LRTLLRTQIATCTVPAKKLMTFNIGYVAGDKKFFHPDNETVRQHQIPARSLKTAITATRALKGAGLKTSSLCEGALSHLFSPDSTALTPGERRYIANGEQNLVSNRYKCRVREPWFMVPGVRTPDVVLSVFSERPILLINDAKYVASNSLLCGYRQNVTSEGFAASWYTSLTRLQCELEVHALGGGVLVMVPREAGNVRLPVNVIATSTHMQRLDAALQSGQVDTAYEHGDRTILKEQLHLTEDNVQLIRQGIKALTHWRTSARTKSS
jgi:adenine-specific DNA-methyltransferase